MGPWEQRADQLEAQARALSSAGQPAAAAEVFNSAGLAALEGGSLARAIPLFDLAAASLTATGDRFNAAAVEANTAMALSRAGHLADARTRYDAALGLLEEARSAGTVVPGRDLDLREADVRALLGVLLRRLGELRQAAEQYTLARDHYARHGREADVVDLECNLAVLEERAGDLAGARRRLTRLRERVPPGSDDRARARASTTLATVAGQEGRLDEAAQLLAEARDTYTALHLPRELAEVVTNRGYVHLHAGDLVAARRDLQHAESMFDAMGMHLDRARVLGGLGSVELRLGDAVEAIERYAVALSVYEHHRLDREIAQTLVNLGVAHLAADDWSVAVECQHAALQLYDQLDQFGEHRAEAEHNLAAALAAGERRVEAARYYARARAAFRRLGRRRDAVLADMGLAALVAVVAPERARRRYRRAAAELRDLRLWPQSARCAHGYGLTWPAGSTARLEQVLPAWLALDQHRFTFTGTAERAQWRDTLGSASAAAFDAAAQNPLLLAEVIEHARALGSLGSTPTTSEALGPPLDLAERPRSPGAELTMAAAVRVGCGWPSTLDPYLSRASAIRAVEPGPPPVPDPTEAVALTLMLTVGGALESDERC